MLLNLNLMLWLKLLHSLRVFCLFLSYRSLVLIIKFVNEVFMLTLQPRNFTFVLLLQGLNSLFFLLHEFLLQRVNFTIVLFSKAIKFSGMSLFYSADQSLVVSTNILNSLVVLSL